MQCIGQKLDGVELVVVHCQIMCPLFGNSSVKICFHPIWFWLLNLNGIVVGTFWGYGSFAQDQCWWYQATTFGKGAHQVGAWWKVYSVGSVVFYIIFLFGVASLKIYYTRVLWRWEHMGHNLSISVVSLFPRDICVGIHLWLNFWVQISLWIWVFM